MPRFNQRVWISAACAFTLLCVAKPCSAHFLWLKTIENEGKPQAFLFFGETPDDEAYHMPEPLTKTKVHRRANDGKREELKLGALETGDRIGLSADIEA